MNVIDNYELGIVFYEGKSFYLQEATTSDNTKVLLKFSKSGNHDPEYLEYLKSNFEFLQTLNNKFFLKPLEYSGNTDNPYVVFDFFSGVSLVDYLNQRESIELKDFFFISKALTMAIDELHQRGFIHNNVNSNDIFINLKSQEVKIVDTENAKELTDFLTLSQGVFTSNDDVHFTSPELTGRMNLSIDYRADWYSLGVILYMLITNRYPFEADDSMEVIHQHLTVDPVAPHEINPNCPKILSNIILKLLSKNVLDRYQSASGIINDLKSVENNIGSNNPDAYFEIGKQDFSKNLVISEKLYGREKELDKLTNYYAHIEESYEKKSELVVVRGVSGIGKTALINELKRNLALKGVFTYSSKCDLSKRNKPYSSIIEALQQFISTLLTEPDHELIKWKKNIQKALGSNGKVVTDVIPELELIIGKQKELNDLPLKESQTRFNFVFVEFIKAISTKERALVLFIDDIQWVDVATLNLLKLFTNNSDVESLFIIGSMRNTDQNSSDPLQVFVESFVEVVNRDLIIDLSPISVGATIQLLADSLTCSTEECLELGNIFHEKTNGNPFFIKQLLTKSYEEESIFFDTSTNVWKWDLQKINTSITTNNVIDLIIEKINKLPEDMKEILKYSAVIGNKISLDIISGICGKPSKETLKVVKLLIKENFFVINSSFHSQNDITYKFYHDKIYQSCLELIDAAEYRQINYELAKIIYEKNKSGRLSDHIIDIVLHYSEAKELIKSTRERELVCELNYQAGSIAKKNNSYHTALKCASDAIELLDEGSWKNNYRTTFKIYFLYIEILHQLGYYDKAEEVCELTLKNSNDLIDCTDIYLLMVNQNIILGNLLDALEIGQKALKNIGVHVNLKSTAVNILAEVFKIKLSIGRREVKDLVNLPPVTNRKYELAIEILMAMAPPSYVMGRKNLMAVVLSKAALINIKKGQNKVSSAVFNSYAFVLRHMGNYNLAKEFGELAIQIENSRGDNVYSCMSYFLYTNSVYIWNHPLEEAAPLWQKAIELGVKNGELLFTSYTTTQDAYGTPSENLLKTIKRTEYLRKIVKVSEYQNVIDTLDAIYYYRKILSTTLPTKISLDFEDFSEELAHNRLVADNYQPGFAYIYFFKMAIAFYKEDFEYASQYLEKCIEYYDASKNMRYEQELVFFGFLTLSSLKNKNSLHLKRMRFFNKKVLKWSAFSNINTQHIVYLFEAELLKEKGDINAAMNKYDEALGLSKKMNLIEHTGVICMMMARFYNSINKSRLSEQYYCDAYHWFKMFRANGICEYLDQKYSIERLLDKENYYSIDATEDFKKSDKTKSLDTYSLIKASRVLSQQVSHERVHSELINIVLESAGADKVFYIEKFKSELIVKAKGEVGQPIEFLSKSLAHIDENELSKNTVYYVHRTLSKLIVSSPEDLENFINDVYIKNNNPRSILCIPILNQGELLGILYLENSKIYHAFTKERLEVLSIISSQAAISLKNAELYSTLEQKVEQRAKEMKEILHNIEEAILTIKPDLTFNEEHSYIAEEFFGIKDFTKISFNDLFEVRGEDTLYSNDWLEKVFTLKDMSKWKLYKGISPLTKYIKRNGELCSYFEIDYQPIFENDRVSKIMLVIKDITKEHIAEIKMQENEFAKREELSKVHGIISNDRESIDNFITGLKEQIEDLESVQYKEILKNNELRNSLFIDVHTLKGNASSFGFTSITEAIHKLESQIHWEISVSDKMSDIFQEWNNSISSLRKEHEKIEGIYNKIYNNFSKDEISISKPKYLKLMNRIQEENICENLFGEVKSLRDKSLRDCCQRLINTVKSYRESTGKDIDDLFIVDGDKLVPRHVMEYLEGCFIHLVRNSLDHGIENNKERNQTGKGIASIEIAFHERDDNYVITIADDGRGIDSNSIKKAALAKGLMEESEVNQLSDKDLIDLIFHPEFSTSKTTNQISGRGMGMYAVKDTLEKVNGSIQISTQIGEGTTFTLTVPQDAIPIIN